MDPRKRCIIGALFFCCILIAWFSGITKYATLENITHHALIMTQFVHDHYGLSLVIFGLLYIASTILAIPMASMLTLVGGFLFGFLPALAYTMIFATAGGLISFFLMRYLFSEFVQQRYAVQLHTFNQAIQVYGARYLLLIRLIPVIPFFLVNIVASCLPISWQVFSVTTALGILPISAIYAYAGQTLSQIHSVYDIFTPRIVLLFTALIGVGIVPIVMEWYKRKK